MAMKKDKCYDLLDSWLGTIEKEVWDLREKREMFSELHKMIGSNPKINQPNAFYVWMNSIYATSMSVAIRRQVDRREGTISLLRFLDKLKNNLGVLTRSLDQVEVKGQIKELERTAENLKSYVNNRLAHHKDGEFLESPTLGFHDIDEAVDCISRIFQYYFHLFRGGPPDMRQSPLISDAWKVIFQYPWIDPTCCESTN